MSHLSVMPAPLRLLINSVTRTRYEIELISGYIFILGNFTNYILLGLKLVQDAGRVSRTVAVSVCVEFCHTYQEMRSMLTKWCALSFFQKLTANYCKRCLIKGVNFGTSVIFLKILFAGLSDLSVSPDEWSVSNAPSIYHFDTNYQFDTNCQIDTKYQQDCDSRSHCKMRSGNSCDSLDNRNTRNSVPQLTGL